MKMHTILWGVVLALLIGSSSCTKDGNTGPIGENGVKGPQGPTGDKGPNGDDSDISNVEIFGSEWSDAVFIGSGTDWKFKIAAPQITQEVLDKYVVHVYFFNNSGNYLYKLPYKGTYASTNKIISKISVGEVEIQSTYKANAKFRFVIIDPNKS
ncbi:collagen-like triple helix repeat-containing protein [Sphingobacterium faecale]|uniref:Collagen-like protein n=1 Tax=Sphingobacterium faecale TaxID=2803775 RepID=A0ABS1R4G0_9SPHI|nr:collagen-like protein [Sphingobacterium faecale]MBL1408892.1 collagen-like protein [Sphingobacterium faecale]